MNHLPRVTGCCLLLGIMLGGCTPTVKIAPPDKPIVINLNVKIEHEIRIKVDKALDDLVSNEELF
ncbi:YnbE family lipoprotein [Shewanella sp. YIC-542]|uniref:YnbE family lipoprotein n=1 Tax=Shewanella mytili TaxID=3377111 RepID=UPI00398F8552